MAFLKTLLQFSKRTGICILFVCLLTGCSLSNPKKYTNIEYSSLNNSITSIPYAKVESEEEILSLIVNSIKVNSDTAYFYTTDNSLIDVNSWINKITGIEQIHCEYHELSDGYNVIINLTYWDNYAIINAFKTGNISTLTDSQLELYKKYCSILNEYTSPTNSDIENELAIHDYLVNNITYVLTDDVMIYNAYDALINGTSVCTGYTECFQTFMDMLGIPCISISGIANNEPHIWNAVELDGDWYHVDVTWDDPVNSDYGVDYSYFNISNSDISKDHSWDTSIYPINATASKYSYANVMGLIHFNSQIELDTYISNQCSSQISSIQFTADSNLEIESALKKASDFSSYSYKYVIRNNYKQYTINFSY